jgi:clan AA aspartic protease (TIGR02281 family)
MLRCTCAWVLGCVVLLVSASAFCADSAKTDALKSNGLTKSGSTYVVPEEADVLEGMKSLHETKKQVDADARVRKGYEAKLTADRNFIKTSKVEADRLSERLAVVSDAATHNRMVARFNLLIVKVNEAIDDQRDLADKIGKVGSDAQTKFVDDLMPLGEKADAAIAKYEKLADDADVKAALAKSGAQAKLGPSTEFAAAVDELKKWRSQVETEAIPLLEEGGVHLVDVRVNGESVPMILDSGSSMITLPKDVAEKLKMVPGPQDPPIKLRIADGNIIEGRQMMIKSVRVGRFTVENVSCVILQTNLKEAPAMLGNSFLSHFVVKLDQKAGHLQLTEVEGGEKKISVIGAKSTGKGDADEKTSSEK